MDGAAGLDAFLTERMAFPGAGLAGADATALPPCFKRVRILPASVSLMEQRPSAWGLKLLALRALLELPPAWDEGWAQTVP